MDIIYGTNTIMSSLKLGSVTKLYLVKGYSNNKILEEAKKAELKFFMLKNTSLIN